MQVKMILKIHKEISINVSDNMEMMVTESSYSTINANDPRTDGFYIVTF